MQFSEEEIENIIQEELLNILKEKSSTPLNITASEVSDTGGPAYSAEVDDEIRIMIGYDYKG
jgi:hypothetical protein